MPTIVTSLCVDIDADSKNVQYPMIDNNAKTRRETYWRCVVTFCLTSLKFNPKNEHIVYTNDAEVIKINQYDIKKELIKKGVRIILLPFNKFDPGNHSKTFRNAFYKLEVIDALSKLNEPSILLDNDCIWTKRDEKLFDLLDSQEYLLLQDTYQRSTTPLKKSPHNLSMKDMGDCFKKIKALHFDCDYPIWYGGELIGGSPNHFKTLSNGLLKTIEYCKTKSNLGEKIILTNGKSIFNGMEMIACYVFNSLKNTRIYDTQGEFSKRMWTIGWPNNFEKNDINLTIWHLTAEKNKGLKNLFYELINKSSIFWDEGTDKSKYLGSFVNIPNTKLTLIYRTFFVLKAFIKTLWQKNKQSPK